MGTSTQSFGTEQPKLSAPGGGEAPRIPSVRGCVHEGARTPYRTINFRDVARKGIEARVCCIYEGDYRMSTALARGTIARAFGNLLSRLSPVQNARGALRSLPACA